VQSLPRAQSLLRAQLLRQAQEEHLLLDLPKLQPSLRQALQPASQPEHHLQKQFRQPVPLILLQLHQILQQPFLQVLS
jgi:hypothetical protein